MQCASTACGAVFPHGEYLILSLVAKCCRGDCEFFSYTHFRAPLYGAEKFFPCGVSGNQTLHHTFTRMARSLSRCPDQLGRHRERDKGSVIQSDATMGFDSRTQTPGRRVVSFDNVLGRNARNSARRPVTAYFFAPFLFALGRHGRKWNAVTASCRTSLFGLDCVPRDRRRYMSPCNGPMHADLFTPEGVEVLPRRDPDYRAACEPSSRVHMGGDGSPQLPELPLRSTCHANLRRVLPLAQGPFQRSLQGAERKVIDRNVDRDVVTARAEAR